MKRLVILLAAALTLTGCFDKPTPEEQAAAKAALPPGCVIHNIGNYGDIHNLVVIVCDGRKVSSLNYTESHSVGKTVSQFQQLVVMM